MRLSTVSGFRYDLSLSATGLLWILFWSVAAFGQTPHYQWTFDNNGVADYKLIQVSDPLVYGGSLPAMDPTINLKIGKRYRVTIVNPSSNPLEIIARGTQPSSDVILLSQGAPSGLFESDPYVAWLDDGLTANGSITFTLTQALADSMRTAGRTPGYRDRVHSFNMRGAFNLQLADPTPTPTRTLTPTPTQSPTLTTTSTPTLTVGLTPTVTPSPVSADLNGDGLIDAKDLLEMKKQWTR